MFKTTGVNFGVKLNNFCFLSLRTSAPLGGPQYGSHKTLKKQQLLYGLNFGGNLYPLPKRILSFAL